MPCTYTQRMTLLWKKDDAVLNDLPGELYTIEDDVKIPDNCKCPFVTYQAGQN